MRTVIIILLGLFLIGCGQQPNAPRIAVCDTQGLFREYTQEEDAALRLEIETLKKEAESRFEKQKLLQAQLGVVDKNSEQYKTMSADLTKIKDDDAAWQKTQNEAIGIKAREIVQLGYTKIYEAAQAVAQEKGCDLLLAPVRVSIGQQSIIYASDAIDITELVKSRLMEKSNANGTNEKIGK